MSRSNWILLIALIGWCIAPCIVAILMSLNEVSPAPNAASETSSTISLFGVAAKDIALAAIGSAAGAWGGAYAAQRINDRATRRRELTDGIQAINVAHSLALQLFNSAVEIRKSFSQRLHDDYIADKARYEAVLDAYLRGLPFEPIRARFNQYIFSLHGLSGEPLRQQIMQRTKIMGRPLLMSLALADTVQNLHIVINQLNAWIEEARRKYPLETGGAPAHIYFGVANAAGHVDRTYSDLVTSIYDTTVSAAYFSHRVCEDLTAHALKLAAEFKINYQSKPPIVASVDFSTSEEFIPKNDPQFASWDSNFPNGAF